MKPIQRRFLPSIAALRSFEAAARHQSFTQAAEELNLSQGAISKQVKEMEQIVGAQLFRRTGREVVLTRAGRQLAADVTAELENIQRMMLRAVSAGNMHATIHVAILPTFASLWLIPRLPDFFDKHPDLEISFSTRLKPFDLAAEGFDLAIHFGRDNWPNTRLRKFFDERMLPVASPEFIAKHGIRSLADAQKAPLLHISSRPSAWHDYLDRTGQIDRELLTGRYFDQFSMVIAAAQASLGIGLLPRYLIEAEIESGALVAVAEEEHVTDNCYYFVTPSGQQDANVEKFHDWMVAQAARTGATGKAQRG